MERDIIYGIVNIRSVALAAVCMAAYVRAWVRRWRTSVSWGPCDFLQFYIFCHMLREFCILNVYFLLFYTFFNVAEIVLYFKSLFSTILYILPWGWKKQFYSKCSVFQNISAMAYDLFICYLGGGGVPVACEYACVCVRFCAVCVWFRAPSCGQESYEGSRKT